MLLSCCSYNLKKVFISSHLEKLSTDIDLYLTKYDKLLFLDNFNTGVEDASVKNFCSSFNLMSMINKPTYFKKPDKPFFIDLTLINCLRSFQNSCVITLEKIAYKRPQPKITTYCSYKYFHNDSLKRIFLANRMQW